jgi:hypothetical protein
MEQHHDHTSPPSSIAVNEDLDGAASQQHRSEVGDTMHKPMTQLVDVVSSADLKCVVLLLLLL